jgi:predicted KAP-like P-loop ATPase
LIKDEEKRSQVIASVANQIFTSKNELLKKAFDEVAQSIQNKDFQLLVVPIIYQADITESKLFKKNLDATTSIKDEEYRSKVISEIATQIPSSEIKLLKYALDKTQTIEFEPCRLKAREAIVKQFPDNERQLILKQDLDARLKQELIDAMQVEDEGYRWQAMAEVATKIVAFDPQLLKQALDVTQAITDEYIRSSSLASIAAHLPIDEKELAIQISLSLENKQHRIIGLTNIAFQSTEFLVLQCPQAQISTVLETIPKGKTSADKAKLLSALAPRLSIGLFPKALKLIQTEITHPAYQAEAVGNLAPYLPSDQLSDALDLVQDYIVGFSYSTDALCNLIPHLSIKELRKAFEVGIAQISDLKLRMQIFLAVAKRLNSIIPLQSQAENLNQKKDLIRDLLRLTHLILSHEVSSNENSITEIITAIAPNLNNDELLTGMLENIVPNIKSEFYLAQALASIAPYLYPEKIDYFSQLAESLQQEYPQAKAFSSFMSVYPDKQFSFIVSLQRSSSNPIRDVEIALIIACRPHPKKEIYLDQLNSDQTKALHLIRTQNRDYDKANYLIQLAPHLLPSQASEAQSIAQDIQDIYHKARSLVNLATYFPQSRSEALHQIEQVKNKRPVEYEPRDKYLIQYIELLCEFTTIVPEQIPALLKTVEEWSKVNSFDSENIPTDPDRKKYKRTIILKALKPHLPIRLSREIDRETSIGKAPQDLWERCLFVLRNEYRQALKSGSFRNDAAQDEDLLNLKDEINALTEMLLMRDLTPPVAVGILGGWGGGKSYMMHLMQKHMVEIRSRGLDPVEAWGFKDKDDKNPDSSRLNRYVGHIYQIKFDAWTYAKSNLWASLMQTIFFELDRQITLEHQIQTALDQTKGKPSSLESQSGAIWQALYETSEEDRKWFLKNVLTEEALEKWENASQNQSNTDQLWDLFASSEQKVIEDLDNLQSQLQKQKKELQKSRAEVLEKGAKYAFFSTASQTAIAVLNERFGTSFTKDIQEKVIKQLSTNIKDYKETQDQASQWGNSIKADIESVFEKQDGNINSLFINEFARKNWLFIFLCFLLILAAILFPLGLANMGVNSIVQTFAGIVPLLSAIPIVQGLLKKGQTIYNGAKVAISEFKQQLEQSLERQLNIDKKFRENNREVQRIEKQLEEKYAAIPINAYASIAEFVSDRLQKGGYQEHLGMMHQVKEDLTMLSKRLLPPPADSKEYTTKVEQLAKVFPRGSARVVLYIDDLDRCPPKTVVEVLEAVQLLVKNPLFIAVLAIDERYITRALADHYKGVLPLKGRPSASDYLEKIIQIPYRIRPISEQALRQYLRAQIVVQDSETSGTKFNEFSPEEFNLLVACCQESELSPRSLKRLTNVYKLYKVLSRTRGQKPTPKEQKTILTLLAFSSRYPDLMRDILQKIGSIFEQSQNADNEKETLFNVFKTYLEDPTKNGKNSYLAEDVKQLAYDVEKLVDKKLELNEIRSIFDFVRTFSFVGDIGVDHT